MASIKKKKQEETIHQLEDLARRLGLEVSYGDMKFAGLKLRSGQCLFKGRPWLILDRKQSFEEKLELFVQALAGFDLSGEELPAEVSAWLRPVSGPAVPSSDGKGPADEQPAS